MNKYTFIGLLFLAINLHASLEEKTESSLCILHSSVKIMANIFDDLCDRLDFLELYLEDLNDLKKVCELIIEDVNYDLFEHVVLITDEKVARMEEKLQMMTSFLSDYIEDHEDYEDELEKIMHVFKQKGHESQKIASELILLLHKNRFIAPFLREKLEGYITEISREIYEIDNEIDNEIDAKYYEVIGDVNTY